MAKLNQVQLERQASTLHVLFISGGERAPWVPLKDVIELTRRVCGCTSQTANGALRSLLSAGLAARAETDEGVFWKLTPAAERVHELFHPNVLMPVLGRVAALVAEDPDA
jgi:hypothetical protein